MTHAQAMSKPAAAGHNGPPGAIETARGVIADLSSWMAANPVIQDEETARAAKPLIDRAKAALEVVEAERDAKVRPLNEAVAAVNAEYKAIHNTDAKRPALFDKVLQELRRRLAVFLSAEEEKRIAAAEEAARLAREAEQKARAAEAAEAEALENAAAGEVGLDVAGVTADADAAFQAFERTSRFAARAERDTKVKIGGGFGRAATLRTVETLAVVDPAAALRAIGLTEKINDALLAGAREYRRERGALPPGVSASTERVL